MLRIILILSSVSLLQGQIVDSRFNVVDSRPQPGINFNERDSISVRDSLNIADPWFGFDKVQHVTFSFLWMLSTQYIMVNKFQVEEENAFPVSLVSGASIGLIKEVYDAHRPNNYFSRRDLIADGLGLLLASCVIMINP